MKSIRDYVDPEDKKTVRTGTQIQTERNVDIVPTGHDEIGKEDDKWDDDVNFMHELQESLNC